MLDKHDVPADQLRIGLYVHLDMKWYEHPFAFSHFKIKTEDQIRIIRSLGVKTERIDPELSDAAAPAQVAMARSRASWGGARRSR